MSRKLGLFSPKGASWERQVGAKNPSCIQHSLLLSGQRSTSSNQVGPGLSSARLGTRSGRPGNTREEGLWMDAFIAHPLPPASPPAPRTALGTHVWGGGDGDNSRKQPDHSSAPAPLSPTRLFPRPPSSPRPLTGQLPAWGEGWPSDPRAGLAWRQEGGPPWARTSAGALAGQEPWVGRTPGEGHTGRGRRDASRGWESPAPTPSVSWLPAPAFKPRSPRLQKGVVTNTPPGCGTAAGHRGVPCT